MSTVDDSVGVTYDYPFSGPEGLEVAPAYARLRAEEPVCRVQMPYGEPGWLVTRHEDVRAVLSDSRFSRAEATSRDEPRTGPEGSGLGLLAMDAPEHTRLRKIVSSAFSARRIESLREPVQAVADALVDRLLELPQPVDLLEHFALRLSVAPISRLLGVPAEDHDKVRIWADAMLSTSELPEEVKREYVGSAYGYMLGLVEQRRHEPQDDLISTVMVRALDEGQQLSQDEAVWLALGLLIAGYENVAVQLVDSMHVLVAHPEQLQLLRSRPELVPRAVEELLRFVPLQLGGAFPRYAKQDVELGGVMVRQGDAVLPDINSANHDPAAFAGPDRLDIRRTQATHMAFGHGAHHCIGAPLARLQLGIGLATLLRRLPGLRLAVPPEDLRWNAGRLVRGPVEYPVAW